MRFASLVLHIIFVSISSFSEIRYFNIVEASKNIPFAVIPLFLFLISILIFTHRISQYLPAGFFVYLIFFFALFILLIYQIIMHKPQTQFFSIVFAGN